MPLTLLCDLFFLYFIFSSKASQKIIFDKLKIIIINDALPVALAVTALRRFYIGFIVYLTLIFFSVLTDPMQNDVF